MKIKKQNRAAFLCLLWLSAVAFEAKANYLPWYFAPNDVEACWNRDITGRHVVVYLLDSPVR